MPSRKSRACRRKKKQANSENGTASRRANDTRENNDKIHSSETRLVPKKHWKKLKLDACLLHDYSTENTTCSAQISAIDKPQEDDVNMTETPESNKEEFSSTITPAECPALVFKEDNPQDQMTSQQQRFVVQDKNQNFIQIPTKRTLENGRQVEVITCFPNVTVQELRNYRRPTTNRSPCPADTWDNKSFQSIAEQQPFATNKWIPQSGNLDTIGTNVRSRQFWGLQPGNNNGIIPESVRNPKPATITSAQAANQDNLFKVPRVPQKSFISKGNNASSQLAQPERVTSDPGNVNLGALGPFTPQVPFYPMGVGDKCKQDCPRCEARINGPKLEMHPAEKAKLRRNHGRTLLSKFNDKVKALYERQWFQRANSKAYQIANGNEQTTDHDTFRFSIRRRLLVLFRRVLPERSSSLQTASEEPHRSGGAGSSRCRI